MREILIVFCILIASCSTSRVSNTILKQDSIDRGDTDRLISFRFVYNGLERGSDYEYLKEHFYNGLQFGVKIPLNMKEIYKVTEENSKVCSVEVTVKDKSDSGSNYRHWLSSLSLGIIPVQFESFVAVKITTPGPKVESIFRYTINKWISIFLVPFFPLTTSLESLYVDIGKDVSHKLGDACYRK